MPFHRLASALVPGLLVACCAKAPELEPAADSPMGSESRTVPVSQLELNHATWEREGSRLAYEAPGQWVLIVGGEVRGPWAEFEDAAAAVDGLAADAVHAYLYRAGVDDVDVTFVLSPFLTSDPHWVQLGRRFQKPQRFKIAAVGNTWTRGEKSVSWGDDGALLRVEPVGGGETLALRSGASGLFQEDLTLRTADAEALGLGRLTAPGRAWYAREEWPCEKVLVRVRIPELDVDWPAVAFVLPRDLTD